MRKSETLGANTLALLPHIGELVPFGAEARPQQSANGVRSDADGDGYFSKLHVRLVNISVVGNGFSGGVHDSFALGQAVEVEVKFLDFIVIKGFKDGQPVVELTQAVFVDV